MKTGNIPIKSNIVEFPIDRMVAPALFMVDYQIGTRVWFVLKGVWVEGKIVSYFAHITPDKTLKEFSVEGAKPASISNVGYAAEYFVPNPQRQADPSAPPFIKQVQLLDSEEIYTSLEELIETAKKRNVLSYPDFGYEEE